MKHLLACLALCASLSASAQDDTCTVLGVQELSSLYAELSASIDTILTGLQNLQGSPLIAEMAVLQRGWSAGPGYSAGTPQARRAAEMALVNEVNDSISTGWQPYPITWQYGYSLHASSFLIVKYADD